MCTIRRMMWLSPKKSLVNVTHTILFDFVQERIKEKEQIEVCMHVFHCQWFKNKLTLYFFMHGDGKNMMKGIVYKLTDINRNFIMTTALFVYSLTWIHICVTYMKM
jgi:hypothetical protein